MPIGGVSNGFGNPTGEGLGVSRRGEITYPEGHLPTCLGHVPWKRESKGLHELKEMNKKNFLKASDFVNVVLQVIKFINFTL